MLHRTAPQTWTATARLDVLSPAQRANLHDRALYRAPLSPEEAGVLGAVAFAHQDGLDYDQCSKSTWTPRTP